MFADTPEPPYTAVIFTSHRTPADDDLYDTTAQHMHELAAEQPGYLGAESVRDEQSRVGITVSYWATEGDARAWKRVAEHLDAQRNGRETWYSGYRIRIATVTRSYDGASNR